MQTFNYFNKRYSVNMMINYININKPHYEEVNIMNFKTSFENKGWRDREGLMYSSLDVLKEPNKYKDEINNILNADLNYPIIVLDDIVIDGMHRLSKALLLNKQYINAYKFSYEDLEKFYIQDIYSMDDN